jgi:hypothetical protein
VSGQSLQWFQQRTEAKIANLSCPVHHRAPEVVFEGTTLREVTISIRCCCGRLSRLANQAIAQPDLAGSASR